MSLATRDRVKDAAEDRAAAALGVMRAAGAADEDSSAVELTQLEGGWSRHSWSLGVEDSAGRRRDYVVRVKPPGGLLETDIVQEYRTYALLEGEPVPTPGVHGFTASPDNPFGGPFFVMDKAPGRAPNVWRRRDRASLEADWAGGGRLARDLVETLAAIHRVEAADDVARAFDYGGLVDHWRGVHESVRLVRDPVVEEAYAWLAEREPDPVPPCLVHGDYRIGNCLTEQGRITAILDWELSFFGDPRFDLGYISLDYLAGKFMRPGSGLLGAVAEREWFYSDYERLSGRPVDREVVRTYSVLGALMLIAILATGVRMYADGRTTDIRMAWSRFAIPGLRQDLTALMGW